MAMLSDGQFTKFVLCKTVLHKVNAGLCRIVELQNQVDTKSVESQQTAAGTALAVYMFYRWSGQ